MKVELTAQQKEWMLAVKKIKKQKSQRRVKIISGIIMAPFVFWFVCWVLYATLDIPMFSI